jgi:hypothetical protein
MIANWNYIVIIICILLALISAWQEYRRRSKGFLLWRILAVVIAAASLACIALPLTYSSDRKGASEQVTALLTTGFNTDSLKDAGNAKVFTLDKEVKQSYPKATLISALDEIDSARLLHIYGDGLKQYELQQLNNASLVFHPSTAVAGVSSISWNDHLKAGEELLVQGTYNNLSAKKIKLVLKGLNTELASAMIDPKAQAAFDLSITPKAAGKLVYTLVSVNGDDTTDQGSIPVQIQPVKPLKVLMLAASPDFETRFLKNWLSENGYAVALRSAISKDKFNSEYINIDQFNLNNVSATALSKFDLVIGDLSVLNTLNNSESAALKQEVGDKGIGVLIRADSTGKTSWLQHDFPVDRPAGKEPVGAAILINGKKSRSNQLNTGLPHIIYRDGTQPLVKQGERILTSSAISGSGKLVFTTLNNTFSWTLAGNKEDYAALWSSLINKAARKNSEDRNTVKLSTLPFVKEPVKVKITQDNPSVVTMNGESMPVSQSLNVPYEWEALYWPSSAGWQQLKQDGNTVWWYTYKNGEWQSLQAAEKHSLTAKYAKKHPAGGIVTKQIQQKVRIAVPKIYFYILLLAACTFLWVETKFS